MGITVRRAVPADAAELARLRVLMWTSMGLAEPDADYIVGCAQHFAERFAHDPDFVALVVDGTQGLVACGCGWIERRLPGFSNPDGRHGFIASMSTDEHARGQGLGRLVFEGLLAWFKEQGVGPIDLHASKFGEPLYRQYGFAEPPSLAMSYRP